MNTDPRHRVENHQLWIDKVRDGLNKSSRWVDFDFTIKVTTLAHLLGVAYETLLALPQMELDAEFARHRLTDPPPVVALQTLKELGYPRQELTKSKRSSSCETRIACASSWCSMNILWGSETQIMLLDDKTAKAIADSSNSEITAAELQHLPHNPCLIEFYRAIEVAENVKRGVRLRGVGFEAVGDAETPAAVVSFYLDYWQTMNEHGGRLPAAIGIWFGGLRVVTFGRVVRTQVGIEVDSELEEKITNICLRIARNLWDFVTSRSIRYESVPRKSRHHGRPVQEKMPEPGMRSDREVSLLFVSRDSKSSVNEGETDRPPLRPWDHRIEIPGTFHEFVYCAKCGDLHRHDLLGQSCRKCGEVVGPRINVRVEKYWHSPYIKGPEGTPLKTVVRDVH